MFITLEGGEGTGKTLQAKMLENKLIEEGHEVVITREPGGTLTAEKIRNVILSEEMDDINPTTEFLLYTSARNEHLNKVIRPALNDGKVVICDRYIDSSMVYQGIVKDVPLYQIMEINDMFIDVYPEVTFLLDSDPEVNIERIKSNPLRERNRFDKKDIEFHKEIREAYYYIMRLFPNRIKKINADQLVYEVSEKMWKVLQEKELI